MLTVRKYSADTGIQSIFRKNRNDDIYMQNIGFIHYLFSVVFGIPIRFYLMFTF